MSIFGGLAKIDKVEGSGDAVECLSIWVTEASGVSILRNYGAENDTRSGRDKIHALQNRRGEARVVILNFDRDIDRVGFTISIDHVVGRGGVGVEWCCEPTELLVVCG